MYVVFLKVSGCGGRNTIIIITLPDVVVLVLHLSSPSLGVEPVATGFPEATQESVDGGHPRGFFARVSVAARSYRKCHP